MEFLANPDLKNVAQGATPTGSTKVAVLEGANNTIKYRSVDDIVSAGGGTTAPRDFQVTILNALGSNNSITPPSIYVVHGENNWGWPNVNATTQADSLDQGAKFVIPFKPANYRISAIVTFPPTYVDGPPSTGDFGVNFEYSTDNSTWNNINTISFLGKVSGDFVTVNGSLSIAGTPSLVYIRTRQSSTLNNSTYSATVQVRMLVANFWS